MSETVQSTNKKIRSRRRPLLLDWDGCCAIDNALSPYALNILQSHFADIALVSNNSTNRPDDFARLLAEAGAPVAARRVFLAGDQALRAAARLEGARALLLANEAMRDHARALGVVEAADAPDIVVLLRDTRFTYEKLERAANALRKGARLIVANPDRTHPAAAGAVKPETGALLAALLACAEIDRSRITMIGKPSPHLFMRACAALDAPPEACLMAGDNPDTDIAGARALGIKAMLVSCEDGESWRALAESLNRDS